MRSRRKHCARGLYAHTHCIYTISRTYSRAHCNCAFSCSDSSIVCSLSCATRATVASKWKYHFCLIIIVVAVAVVCASIDFNRKTARERESSCLDCQAYTLAHTRDIYLYIARRVMLINDIIYVRIYRNFNTVRSKLNILLFYWEIIR